MENLSLEGIPLLNTTTLSQSSSRLHCLTLLHNTKNLLSFQQPILASQWAPSCFPALFVVRLRSGVTVWSFAQGLIITSSSSDRVCIFISKSLGPVTKHNYVNVVFSSLIWRVSHMGWDLCWLHARILFQLQVLNCFFSLISFFIFSQKLHFPCKKYPEQATFKKELLICQYFSCARELIIITFSTLSSPFFSTEKSTATTKIEKKWFLYPPFLGKQKKERKHYGLTKHTQVCKTSLQHKEALMETTD